MKKSLILSLFLIAAAMVSAQDIYETTKSMSLGTQTVYYMDVEAANAKTMEKVWKEYIKDNYDAKVKKNKKAKEFYSKEVQAAVVNGSAPLTFYLKIEEGKGQSTAYLWTDVGGAFVNSDDYESQSDGVIQVMTDYYVSVRKKIVSEELKDQEKSLQKLDKEQSKLIKRNEGYHKDIEKASKKISEAEEKIEKNLTEQADKKMEIDVQKKVVEKIIAKLNNIGREKE